MNYLKIVLIPPAARRSQENSYSMENKQTGGGYICARILMSLRTREPVPCVCVCVLLKGGGPSVVSCLGERERNTDVCFLWMFLLAGLTF